VSPDCRRLITVLYRALEGMRFSAPSPVGGDYGVGSQSMLVFQSKRSDLWFGG